jgi:anhydro-N-acetylmuramic acid kinase
VKPELYIGLISGTSRDGVDAALVRFGDRSPKVLQAECIPYPADIVSGLERLQRAGRRPDADTCRVLDRDLARHFAACVGSLLEASALAAADIEAVGSHGQTVWHEPDGPEPVSIQLGDPQQIALATGIVTVGGFRQADIEAGGQGAPLAPLLHRALFRPEKGRRVVLNLGGIANISAIDERGRVSGFDTGPANCLLDAWVRSHRGEAFDRDGRWAAGGTVVLQLLEAMLGDPYFRKLPPKSTGVEYFNLSWLEGFAAATGTISRDVQATLAELTARSVAEAVRTVAPGDLVVCGGGVHNGDLLGRIRRQLPGLDVLTTDALGLDPDWVEAVLFAWLARERLAGREQDTRNITGAARPVLLGTPCFPR